MKIAIINPRISYYVGGGERVALRHAEYLSRIEGNVVDVFTIKPVHGRYSPMYVSRDKNKNLSIIEKEVPIKNKDIYDVEPGAEQIRWDKESIMFNDLVHEDIVGGGYEMVLSYYIVDSLFKDPLVPNAVYLGGYPRKRIPLYTAFLTSCDAAIFNSQNVKKFWSEDLADSGLKSSYVLGKGADKPEIKRTRLPEKKIVFAGRLIERKGVGQLVNVFSKVNKKVAGSKLYIIGDGPLRNDLEKQVADLGLKNNIEFTGAINNAQDHFINADICVFPSLEGEGLMTVVAEAMMSGSCVITSKGMGNEEIVENLNTGILITPGDERELEQSILECLSKPDICSEIGQNARKYAEESLTWESVAKQLHSILREVKENFDKSRK